MKNLFLFLFSCSVAIALGAAVPFTIDANPRHRVEVLVGDPQETELRPRMATSLWDGECILSVELVDAEPTHGAAFATQDTVVWSRAGRTARFYRKETKDEYGAFEFEVEYANRPASNIVEFAIESHGLNFWYQPPLTPEEIAQGDTRPENVVGSYAAYHATRRDNELHGKEYRAGKAFHIYRPFATDAAGRKVWCEMLLAFDRMFIVVPNDFLDTAVYPIVVDPTFGYTTAGGTSSSASVSVACYYTSPAGTGTINDFQVSMNDNGAATNYVVALYAQAAVLPTTLLASGTAATTDGSNTQKWFTNSNISYAFSAGTVYYLAVWNASGIQKYYDTAGAAATQWQEGTGTYPTWPNPFGTPSFTLQRQLSIYADYTASGAATVKTVGGLALASVKTWGGLAAASVKTIGGFAAQ